MRKRRNFRSLRRRAGIIAVGIPKFGVGEIIGDFVVKFYDGHSYINKRNNRKMSKPQHWYYCKCTCGKTEHRSQQELIDKRRQQCCEACRKLNSPNQ